MAREPISIVQIDQDFCSRTHGTAPCTATGEPCFNTRATCQDVENYALGDPLPLKFVKNRSPQMRDDNYLPFLISAEITPAKLNPGGASSGMTALGMRATLTATFSDHPHSDFLVDPYVADRDYNPLERSTFWAKWRARNLYYLHRPISFISGYYSGGTIVDAVTRRFVITGFSGPDSDGKVTINAKDILTLAEGGKAQAPAQSTGELSGAITNVAGTATLAPAGIGNLEYPASGYIRIEKEVIAFTRSSDTLTLTTRGAYGTTAEAHDAGANVQLCLQYTSESPHDILEDLLVNYAGIPSGYLDLAQWEEEAITNGFLPYLYSALITAPESVSKLIGELCEQMYFALWYDERDAKVKIRALRFAQGEEITDLTDSTHLLKDSVAWTDRPDEQVTQVWVYYAQINPVEKLDDEKNYAAVEVVADIDAESAERYNTKRIRKVFSRWIGAGNAAAAVELAETLHQRFGNVPRAVSFALDAKDRALWLGDFVRLHNRLNVNQFGQLLPANVQIYQAKETEIGSKYSYIAQEFIPASTTTPIDDVIELIISADMLNVNLRALYDASVGITPVSGDVINFIIRQGVIVGGDTAGGGSNVLAGSRSAANDFYDAGNANLTGTAVGLVPCLQRNDISTVRTTAANASYTPGGVANWIIVERPVSKALVTGNWPSGVVLNLIVEAGSAILGEGGNGGAHSLNETQTHTASGIIYNDMPRAGDGGHALEVTHPINITNNGTIAGGGGGGSALVRAYSSGNTMLVPGGGGNGFKSGNVCASVLSDGYESGWSRVIKTAAEAGTTSLGSTRTYGANLSLMSPGATLTKHEVNSFLISGAEKGRGGILAGAGSAAQYKYTYTPSIGYNWTFAAGTGGQAGQAVVDGAELINWVVKGDVRGTEN